MLPGSDPTAFVRRAQAGDGQAREALLKAYVPFVLRVVSDVTGRWVSEERDDEASIGLIAFNEAIDRYDPERGPSFVRFSELVIRRRLVDYYRRQSVVREVPFSSIEDREGSEGARRELAVQGQEEAEVEALARRQDILRYRETLESFGIDLGELVRLTPQHRDARARALAVARRIAAEPRLWEHVTKRRELPLSALARDPAVGLSRKTLERQRKYILALALALGGGFETLAEYIGGGDDARHGA
ncbi:MAG: RNA polymerase sigma-I factor [Clostridia bacterium]|nr:RNA polymerase sigma-I factor [Clostridia bacterium]